MCHLVYYSVCSIVDSTMMDSLSLLSVEISWMCDIILCVAGEVASTLSHVMVTNPTKNILAETQSRLADIIAEMQRNLSKLMLALEKAENKSER